MRAGWLALALALAAAEDPPDGGDSGDGWLSAAERAALCDGDAHPFPPPSRRPIRWVHVPKTGTSFMNTVWHHACRLPPTASAADFASMYEQQFADRYPPALHCAAMLDHTPATHKPVGDGEWAAHSGAFVTMLRQPAARLVSAFRHGRHCIQDCSPQVAQRPPCRSVRDSRRLYKCKALRRAASVQAYAAEPAARGCAARMLLGRACNEPLELHANETARAADRIASGGFGFVGLVEEWELSVCLFHRLLGGRPKPLEFAAVRVNRAAGRHGLGGGLGLRGDIDPADEAVYAAGRARFRRQVREALAGLA